MADPLSIAASIAGLLTLSTQISVGLSSIISAAKSAPSLLERVSNDLLLLCEIFRQLEILTQKWRRSAADSVLPATLERCRESLHELKTIVETLQNTFVGGGYRKRWLQVTWAVKEKEIASISSRISDYKSTLTLALQMQHALDIGDVKDAIEAFLATKSELALESPRRKEILERYIKSTPESLYSISRPSSLAPSSMQDSMLPLYYDDSEGCGRSSTSSKSIRTISLDTEALSPYTINPLSPASRTYSQTTVLGNYQPYYNTSSEETLQRGSDAEHSNSAARPSLISSEASSELILPSSRKRESPSPETLQLQNTPKAHLEVHGSPSNSMVNPEEFWASLVSELQLTSPAPYSSFQELYMATYQYLWLHGRVWHGDKEHHGTLLVSKYSPQSGEIEFSRILVAWASGDLDYYKGLPKVRREDATLGLKHETASNHYQSSGRIKPYLFFRIIPTVPKPDSAISLWPPLIIPAKERTSRVSLKSQGLLKSDQHYSSDLFGLLKRNRISQTLLSGSWSRIGDEVELFSALDPELYTPDLEHPLRGIWIHRQIRLEPIEYDFILFHQPTRNKLEDIKLTGNPKISRGERSFILEDLEAKVFQGKVLFSQRSTTFLDRLGTLQWIGPDEVLIEYEATGLRQLRYTRLDMNQFI